MNWQDYSIAEIRDHLQDTEITEELITYLRSDPRKGVQKLASKYIKYKKQERIKLEQWQLLNNRLLELKTIGYSLVAGIDEAGRGPLAGPVVAAAVILDPEIKIIGLNDSKILTKNERERLFPEIMHKAIAVGIGIVDNIIIDKVNILRATLRAMQKAVEGLNPAPEYLLIDGNCRIPDISLKQETIISGDSKVNSIAAASIIAKVSRDKILDDYHSTYPIYNFLSNKGYGTNEHIKALKEYGPCPIHRYSFSIVSKYSVR